MPFIRAFPLARALAGVALLATLAACATAPELTESRDLASQGRLPEAVQRLEAGVRRDPENIELRAAYIRRRDQLVTQWLGAADAARQGRRPDEAKALYDQVLSLTPDQPRARAGLDALRALAAQEPKVAEAERRMAAGQWNAADALLREVILADPSHPNARRLLARLRERQLNADLGPPVLKQAMDTMITLELRDMPLRNAFDVMARTAPLNFVFDKDVRTDAKVTIAVKNSPVHDVMRLLLLTQQLDYKVLNDNSVLIYPSTAVKQRDYQDLTARVFYLTNADAKQLQAMLRTVGKVKEVHVDEKLNMVAVRDTAPAVRLAERLIQSIDVAEPEVMLEVEILEISRTRALDLGIEFPSELKIQSTLPLAANVPSGVVQLARGMERGLVATIANPALRVGLSSTDANVNLLANPRIRAKNREKAKILIGEKLPVFTSTAVQNAGVSSSVSYIDVGLKLEVEPNVYLDDEIGIKVNLEVNSNLERITENNTTAFRLGTRTAQTSLRLRDGETQVLAGLINDNERDTLAKLPGVGDIPALGRLFGNTNRSREKTEIVLLITPRVLRNIVPPDVETLQLAAGTESAVGAQPLSIAPTPARALSIKPATGGEAGAAGAPTVPSGRGGLLPGIAPASEEAPAAAPLSVNPSATLQAPGEVSMGKDFVVQVEVSNAGDAQSGEVILQFDPAQISGAGRATVAVVATGPGTLSGSISLKALAAGNGTANLSVVGGSVRLGDGKQRPVVGAATSVRIGL